MPKRHMTLDEAFAVFEREGLEVKVVGLKDSPQKSNINDFIQQESTHSSYELDYSTYPPTRKTKTSETKKGVVKCDLYTQHSVGCAGKLVDVGLPSQRVEGALYSVYGPGMCEVPIEHAQHILHQDALARQGDARLHDRVSRNYIVESIRTQDGRNLNLGFQVADISQALGDSRFKSLGGL